MPVIEYYCGLPENERARFSLLLTINRPMTLGCVPIFH